MKRLLRVLVVLVVVALVLVAGDRVAVRYAEGRAAQEVEAAGTDVSGVDVDITGFPFLTQLVAGELTHVTGTMERGTFSGYEVSDVHVDARGVGTADPYPLTTGTADGLLSLASLEQAVEKATGLDVTVGAGDSTLTVTATVPTALLDVELTARVEPSVVDATTLGVEVVSVSLAGATVTLDDLPGGLGSRLQDLRVPLTLPQGVSLTTARVEDGAVRLGVSGQDVPLADLAAS